MHSVVTLLKARKSRRCSICGSEIGVGSYYISIYSREYRGRLIVTRFHHYCLRCVAKYIDLMLIHRVRRLILEVENGEIRKVIPDTRYKLSDSLRRLLQKYASSK